MVGKVAKVREIATRKVVMEHDTKREDIRLGGEHCHRLWRELGIHSIVKLGREVGLVTAE